MKLATGRLLLLLSAGLVVHGRCDDDKWEKAKKRYEENVRIAARHPVKEFKKAIEDGDLNTVKRLLDEGVPASLPMPWSEDRWEGPVPPTDFPIHLAVSAGHIEIVRLLLDRGADAKAPGGEGDYTPLHQANDPEIAKLLISRGADVNARNASGDQPVHSATYPSHLENRRNVAVGKSLSLIQFLVQHGADPLAKDDSGTQGVWLETRDPWKCVLNPQFLIDRKL